MLVLKVVFLFKIFGGIWLVQNISFNDAVIMKFTNYKCEDINPSILQVHQCRLKAVKRDVVSLHFNATLLVLAQKMRVEVALFKKANGYKPWLYKVNVDLCRFIVKAYNPIAKAIIGEGLRFTNLNHSCPYQGIVFLQDWVLKPEAYLLLPFPTGDYLIESKWYINQKFTAIAKYYFTFVEDL